jgi:hypothetical protein
MNDSVEGAVRDRIRILNDPSRYDSVPAREKARTMAKNKFLGAQRELESAEIAFNKVWLEKKELEEWLDEVSN